MATRVQDPGSPPAARRPGGLLSRRIVSWALYDLANTIFSMNIVSLYLSLWVINVMGGTDATWGYANSFSMFLMLLTAPLLGAVSDQAGRRLPFLLGSTITCVAFTALLGTGGLAWSIAFFIVANYFFQAGLIFYDATLPVVSTPENRGRVGGFGIGLGYLGSFLGVMTGLLFLERLGYIFLFRATALLFLLFAIPIFLYVQEPRRQQRLRLDAGLPGRALRQVRDTLSHVKRYRGLGRFLVGRVFYVDAANTVIIFMGVYVTNEVGFTQREAQILLLVAIAAAVAGGLALGHVVDRIGPKRTLNLVLTLWMVTLAGAMLIALAGLPKALFWPVACLAGIALGGNPTSDRPLMLTLSPPGRVGEFYGLYSMVGRFAAVVGPALWALVSETLGLGRPLAIGSLLLMVVVGYLILRPVDDAPRAWRAQDLEPVTE
ncbi:MAG: MFS transporter [Gemmatimonadetes bacterium]|nr:MFS transporter [Gemmatimonadota bacterium]